MDVSGKPGQVPYGTLVLATAMLLAHGLEGVFGCRKWCSEHLDFTGDALLHGKLWVMFSSSFLHGTHSHFLREAFLMILAGVPLEVEIGTWFFVVVFLFCGAVGCSCSWLTLRWTLRRNPDFSQMPREHVDAIANLSNSRGASACVYGIAVLAVLLRSYPLAFGSVFLVLLLLAFSLPAELTVSNSLLFWFFVHCFFRAYPSLLALGPPREFAATDHLGHIYGALAALLLGAGHLFRRLTVGSPHLQSWLALTVLCISTLP